MSIQADSPFDVFLSHNSRDKTAVEHIAEELKRAGLEPWFDKWCLTPGGHWQEELAAGLKLCSACAVFIGPHGPGDWVREELGVALNRSAKDRSFRLFLVLMPELDEPFDAASLPPFLSTRTWVDMRKGVADPRGLQALINAIKGIPLGPGTPVERRNDICPYRGLQTFDKEHAEFFFGRDADIQRLLEKLKATRFLAVLGPSGSCKSSLVRAGSFPALFKGGLPDSYNWPVRVLMPGTRPLTTLAAYILHLHPQDIMHKTVDEMSSDARTLHFAVSLALADRPVSERVEWIIDQFEEVFTVCRDESERAQVLANLLYASSIPDGRNVVILTMRADFYSKCAAFPELAALITNNQFLVSPLLMEGLRKVIEEPARHVGLELEEGLVGTILEDVENQPGALPLLEHALLELWERRRGHWLTLEAYRKSGGVHGAIARRAEALYKAFNAEQQAVARKILLRLTQPGERTEDTRRRASMSEVITRLTESDVVEAVVRALADARLLTTGGDAERWIDISHEALIRGWPRLRDWIEEDRAGLRLHRRLTETAQEWAKIKRDEGLLYRGARLVQATEWREHNQSVLNDLEREFLDASMALLVREQRAAQRRLRWAAAGLISALALISTFALVAFQQRNAAYTAASEADRQRHSAEMQASVAISRELAAKALFQLPADPELSVLLAVEAMRVRRTAEAQDALRRSLSESPARATLRGHDIGVEDAVFSPDNQLILTTGEDGTKRLWETDTGKSLATFDKDLQVIDSGNPADTIIEEDLGALRRAAFSPDGNFVATASSDGTARVYPLEMFTPAENLLALAATRATRTLTPEERAKYLHEAPSE